MNRRYSFYLVKYRDGTEDAFKVDRLHARGSYRSLFGSGTAPHNRVIEITEINEAECKRIWGGKR